MNQLSDQALVVIPPSSGYYTDVPNIEEAIHQAVAKGQIVEMSYRHESEEMCHA